MMGLRRGCREIEPFLWNYAAHTLPEQEIERVETHLDACAFCRQQAEEYRVTFALTSDFRDNHIPESEQGWTQLCAQIEARQETPLKKTLRPRWTLPAWSGAALAAAAVALFFLRSGPATGPAPAFEVKSAPGVAQMSPLTEKGSHEIQRAEKSGEEPPMTQQVAAKPNKPLPQNPSRIAFDSKEVPRSQPKRRLAFHPNKRRSQPQIARHNAEPRAIVPEKPPKRENRPLLVKREYAVDGEKPLGSDLSQNYVALMVPQNENAPMRRSFVMDQIPVAASMTSSVSNQPQTQELQAW